jgi:hypothetical protein
LQATSMRRASTSACGCPVAYPSWTVSSPSTHPDH